METFHWGPTGAGLIFVALSVPSLAGVQIGKAVDRIGVRIIGAVSFLGAACALILMRLVTKGTIEHIILQVFLLLLLGLAVVCIEISTMTEVSQVIGDYESRFPGSFGDKSPVAQAYALFNMAFAGGQLLGPIMAGGIRVHGGWGTMTLVLGLLCAVVAAPFGLFSGVQPRATETESDTTV